MATMLSPLHSTKIYLDKLDTSHAPITACNFTTQQQLALVSSSTYTMMLLLNVRN